MPAHDASIPDYPVVRGFDETDFNNLTENQYGRFLSNASKVGHAAIKRDQNGNEIAAQYQIPPAPPATADTDDDHVPHSQHPAPPTLRPMLNIKKFSIFGQERYLAESPMGTKFRAKRFIDLEDNGEPTRVALFSPMSKNEFWGSTASFGNFCAEIEQHSTTTKGGREVEVKQQDAYAREAMTSRGRSQNDVMGQSAVKALAAWIDDHEDKLTAEQVQRLRKLADAPLTWRLEGNVRCEWLHAIGFALSQMDDEPQDADNLGCGPKWANTEMMILERMAKWFAKNNANAITKILPHFLMLFGSDIIKHIDCKASVQLNGHLVRMFQQIDPFAKTPMFRKASDIAQGTLIVEMLLKNIPPASLQNIQPLTAPPKEVVTSMWQAKTGTQAKLAGRRHEREDRSDDEEAINNSVSLPRKKPQ